jgi:hypothetical protein
VKKGHPGVLAMEGIEIPKVAKKHKITSSGWPMRTILKGVLF